VSRYVELLEREAEQAKDERDFLREQIDRKDKTIDALIELNQLLEGDPVDGHGIRLSVGSRWRTEPT
jgi:hypothetical protein